MTISIFINDLLCILPGFELVLIHGFNPTGVYPGQVIWEGTNISEGRGTCQPFELFGAPFIHSENIIAQIYESIDLDGCFLRPLMFEPASNKWAGETCRGFQIHVTDPAVFRPYRTSLALLQAVMLLHPKDFRYKEPPYESEYDRLPLALLLGAMKIRQAIEQGKNILELEDSWQDKLNEFNKLRQDVFLYN